MHNTKEQRKDSPSNSPRDITRLASNEETPPPLRRTPPRQRLEIKQLPDRTPPAGQQHLVQRQPVPPRRPGLERRLVPRHGREVAPYPPQRRLPLLDAAERVRWLALQVRELGVRLARPRELPARSDDQDVAEADLGALRGEAGLEIGQRDGRRGEGVEFVVGRVRLGLLEAPAMVVCQYAAANYAFFCPGW